MKYLSVRPIDQLMAKNWITQRHYSRTFPQAVKFRFGLYYGDQLSGVAVFSIPANRFSFTSIFEGFDQRRGVELTRFHTLDGMPPNFQSEGLSRCFAEIKCIGHYDVIISYADETFGHKGGLYKALSGIYLGTTKPEPRYKMPDGRYITRRALGRRIGESAAQSVTRLLSEGAVKEMSGRKHKFLWFICGRRRKKELIKTAKQPLTFKQ